MNLIKIKLPKITPVFTLNILLHITILFTILSLIFTYYIAHVSTNAVNAQIDRVIDQSIKTANFDINTIKNKINELLEIQREFKSKIPYSSTEEQYNIEKHISEITHNIDNLKVLVPEFSNEFPNININSIINKNISYEYYEKIFSKENIIRKCVNREVLFYIKLVSMLLILILCFYTFTLFKNNQITMSDIKLLTIENTITFIFIGIIEYLFFTNVALKYVPCKPSILSTAFKKSLVKQFET